MTDLQLLFFQRMKWFCRVLVFSCSHEVVCFVFFLFHFGLARDLLDILPAFILSANLINVSLTSTSLDREMGASTG